jgi:hypothetical protein
MAFGTILFWLERPESFGFGFISSDDAPNNREANVWFSRRALHYGRPRKGDRVEYSLIDRPLKIGESPTADTVELVDDNANAIQTLAGEDEV